MAAVGHARCPRCEHLNPSENLSCANCGMSLEVGIQVVMPKGVSVARKGLELKITRRIRLANVIGPSALLSLGVGAFLACGYIFSQDLRRELDFFQLLWESMGATFVLFSSFSLITETANRRSVRISPTVLEIGRGRGLLPFQQLLWGDPRAIRIVYCQVYEVQGAESGKDVSYRVTAVTTDGAHEELLTLDGREEALFFTQEINAFLRFNN